MKPVQWVKTHVAASIVAGVVLVASGTGAAVAATAPQFQPTPEVVADSTPSPTVSSHQDGSNEVGSVTEEDPTTGPTTTDPGTPPATGGTVNVNAPAPAAPVADPEPAPEPPAPSYIPDAPTGVSIQASGAGYLVTWNAPNTNGATIANYWVDVTNSSYSAGDRMNSSGTSISLGAGNPALNCIVVGSVTTNGVQGASTGVICPGLW